MTRPTNRGKSFTTATTESPSGKESKAMAMYNGYKSKAAAMRDIKAAGFTFGSALAAAESNPKLLKSLKKGIYSAPLHLAPASLSGFNVCAQASPGCIAACLNTAGNPLYREAKAKARHARTLAYFKARKAFVALVAFEIEAHELKAAKRDMLSAIRLNATSDIAWERVPLEVNGKPVKNLFEAFPNTSFYDYSKVTKRALQWAAGLMPVNYHLTFSKSESNDSDVERVLAAGGNVAVVFDKLPESYLGKPVINGDEYDFRPLDEKGVVVGLKAKGEAKADSSGFVVKTRVDSRKRIYA